MASHGMVRKADALRQLGQLGRLRDAAAKARAARRRFDAGRLPLGLSVPEIGWLSSSTPAAVGNAAAAQDALAHARAWLQRVAENHAPPALCVACLHRQTVERWVMPGHGA